MAFLWWTDRSSRNIFVWYFFSRLFDLFLVFLFSARGKLRFTSFLFPTTFCLPVVSVVGFLLPKITTRVETTTIFGVGNIVIRPTGRKCGHWRPRSNHEKEEEEEKIWWFFFRSFFLDCCCIQLPAPDLLVTLLYVKCVISKTIPSRLSFNLDLFQDVSVFGDNCFLYLCCPFYSTERQQQQKLNAKIVYEWRIGFFFPDGAASRSLKHEK